MNSSTFLFVSKNGDFGAVAMLKKLKILLEIKK